MPNFNPVIKSLKDEHKIRQGLGLYHFLSRHESLDSYSVYATCRAWFYKENIPMERLDEVVSSDILAKRHLLGERYEYQV